MKPPIRLLPLLAGLLALQALAANASLYHLVAVVPVNTTSLDVAAVSQPLLPLTKVECGGGVVAVVYGPGYGKPVAVAVYAVNGTDWRRALPACIPRLEPCLAAAGAYGAVKRLEELVARSPPSVTGSKPGIPCSIPRPTGLLMAAALAAGASVLLLRLYRRRGRGS